MQFLLYTATVPFRDSVVYLNRRVKVHLCIWCVSHAAVSVHSRCVPECATIAIACRHNSVVCGNDKFPQSRCSTVNFTVLLPYGWNVTYVLFMQCLAVCVYCHQSARLGGSLLYVFLIGETTGTVRSASALLCPPRGLIRSLLRCNGHIRIHGSIRVGCMANAWLGAAPVCACATLPRCVRTGTLRVPAAEGGATRAYSGAKFMTVVSA